MTRYGTFHISSSFIHLSLDLLLSRSMTESTVSFTWLSFLIAPKFTDLRLSYTTALCFACHLRVRAIGAHMTQERAYTD